MEGFAILLCVLASVYIGVTEGCDMGKCLKNNQLMIPQACQDYTTMLTCIKKEFDSCTDPMGKQQMMMGMQYVMRSGAYCGYDMNQLNQMMSAHTNLMTSLWNGTNGMGPMMMGGDGPFGMGDDDGPMGDDGPFDDGPFDDGPFDDGPFDDGPMGHGMIPFLAQGGATDGKKDAPPPAPGLLPTFRGGSMMQTNDRHDYDSGSGISAFSWSLLTTAHLLVLFLLHEM